MPIWEESFPRDKVLPIEGNFFHTDFSKFKGQLKLPGFQLAKTFHDRRFVRSRLLVGSIGSQGPRELRRDE